MKKIIYIALLFLLLASCASDKNTRTISIYSNGKLLNKFENISVNDFRVFGPNAIKIKASDSVYFYRGCVIEIKRKQE